MDLMGIKVRVKILMVTDIKCIGERDGQNDDSDSDSDGVVCDICALW